MADETAFFTCDGDLFVPTALARSPWSGTAITGLAVSGLLMRAFEMERPDAMHLARFTVDFLGEVPNALLRLEHTWDKRGGRLSFSSATLSSEDGRVGARASAMWLRDAETPAADFAQDYPRWQDVAVRPFFRGPALGGFAEMRPVEGKVGLPGRGIVWAKPRFSVVAGQVASPLCQAAILSDMGNGIGTPVDGREYSFANTDIGLHLYREPVGEWLMIDSQGASGGRGDAVTHTTFADERGVYARGWQTLFVAPYPAGQPSHFEE
ncbi:MAG: acyl-CoA thioesterase domain-containing protein [Tsuneonella suprasediminis]|uniref:Thioesterase family protein n=1 Tax=Tsuneonella suprasediminis TaxID=2306996 RepID=A0A419R427_9SPHN|nr:acyl-CoA thioesterase domain-containing protein [Tsuneonella suprasediminis]RJX69082.1 thioesterase family protein [Tsuneonella suprasediminis]UBS34242.1 thioesterase family protein [Altererythrobacter sp. N1]